MTFGQELSSIDFQSMIGGPLNAVVKAQAQSAQTSIDFIKSVGFDSDGMPTMVDFEYNKMIETQDDSGAVSVTSTPMVLSVPILTMLPIPFIKVEETTIDFNAKINSVAEATTASSSDLNSSMAQKSGWGPFSAELKCSHSAKKSNSATSKTERTYNLAIHVRAVQDELPAGTERLLGILENAIKETPKSGTPSTP